MSLDAEGSARVRAEARCLNRRTSASYSTARLAGDCLIVLKKRLQPRPILLTRATQLPLPLSTAAPEFVGVDFLGADFFAATFARAFLAVGFSFAAAGAGATPT